MWYYFGGCDVARGGAGLSKRSGDDFVLATMRADETGPVQIVDLFRKTGIEAGQASALIHKKNNAFRYTRLVMDPSGGGLGVRDELRKPIQNTGKEQFMVTPIITEWDEQLFGVGNPILALFMRGETMIQKSGMIFPAESSLIGQAHEKFRAALQLGDLKAPPSWTGWPRGMNHVDTRRLWLNEQPGMGAVARAQAEIDLALLQLIEVERKAGPDGEPLLDKHGQYTWTSRYKKDAAYALVYCYFSVHIWRQAMAASQFGNEEEGEFVSATQVV